MSNKLNVVSPTMPLTSTVVAPVASPVSSGAVILPRIGVLPAGIYTSEILSIAEAVQNGVAVGVDFVHHLTDAAGKQYDVKFRVYAPWELDRLVEIFASYDLNGLLDQVSVGLQEEVEIAPKANSAYMGIVGRRLMTPPTGQPALSPPATPSTPSAPPPPSKRGVLGGKRPASSKPPRNLLEEDDDDDFVDLDFEDDDC